MSHERAVKFHFSTARSWRELKQRRDSTKTKENKLKMENKLKTESESPKDTLAAPVTETYRKNDWFAMPKKGIRYDQSRPPWTVTGKPKVW